MSETSATMTNCSSWVLATETVGSTATVVVITGVSTVPQDFCWSAAIYPNRTYFFSSARHGHTEAARGRFPAGRSIHTKIPSLPPSVKRGKKSASKKNTSASSTSSATTTVRGVTTL